MKMPTKHRTNPHQPNGKRQERLALDEVLQKDVNYPVHTTPTGEAALVSEVGYKLDALLNQKKKPFSCDVFAITKKVSMQT